MKLQAILVPLCAALSARGGLAADAAAPKGSDWPMWGGSPGRNQANAVEKGIPAEWDVEKGKGVKWKADIGSRSYGNPVVGAGKVFVGTNNERERNPKIAGDRGVVMCFRESDGAFLWQAAHDKLESGRANDYPEEGIGSSPCVDGNRVYYVSNRCELVCADVEGFRDGKNDGPFTGEKYTSETDADFVWILDMIGELGVFPHNLATSSPLVAGDLVYVLTSNGVDEEDHEKLPHPEAPSFIAVDKKSGKVAWKASPASPILHGQWSSPSYAEVAGRPQVIFPAGDGWLYAFEPATGKPLWKFDANPKDAKYATDGKGTRNPFVATAAVDGGRIYIAVGDDPQSGDGPGHLYAIDPAPAFAAGAAPPVDITESGRAWHAGGKEFGRTISSATVHDGIVYAASLSGFVHAFDAKTGKPLWTHDLFAAVWGTPAVIDGKVLVGDEDGDVVVFAEGKQPKVIAKNGMGSAVYGTPVAAHGVLFIASRTKLFAIEARP